MVITIRCAWPMLLAYLFLAQLVALGVVALVSFRAGEQFEGALRRFPQLVALREECRRKRKNAAVLGALFGAAVVLAWRPFDDYSCGGGGEAEAAARRRFVLVPAGRGGGHPEFVG